MEAIATGIEKLERSKKTRERGFRARLKNLVKAVYNWELIDGDAFLESKDWPYVWKK
jgi:hypothetical protein